MHPLRRHDMRADGVDQRAHQPRRLPDPVRQGRAKALVGALAEMYVQGVSTRGDGSVVRA